MFIVCICVTVKIQFGNTSTCNYSTYSPSTRSLGPVRVRPPFSKILDPPLVGGHSPTFSGIAHFFDVSKNSQNSMLLQHFELQSI